MTNKSLINTAYDVLTQKYAAEGAAFTPIAFGELLTQVGAELGMESEEQLLKIASRFYTDLTLDGRFVIKENNTWSLREHEKFADVHIDMNDVYGDRKNKEEGDEDDDDDNREDGDILDSDDEDVLDDEDEEELGEETGDEKVYSTDEDE